MLELLLTLTPIGLLDSMSAVPIAVIPLAIILNGRQPLLGSISFISGGFVTYFLFGILLLMGLDTFIDEYAEMFISYVKSEPNCVELVIQIILGFAMIYFASQFSKKAPRGSNTNTKEYQADITPLQAFTISATIMIIGMWGALPYFAAIAQILKADLETLPMVSTLIYYNVIFALPLVGFIILRAVMGDRAQGILDTITRFFTHWGKQIMLISLYILGPLLIADGIGWFAGYPILDFTE